MSANQFNKIYSERIPKKDVVKILRQLQADIRKDTKKTFRYI